MAAKKKTVNCGDTLTIAQAADLHQQLRQAMEASSTVEVVADKIEKVDTAGLQLIIAALREIEKAGGHMVWKQPSPVLLDAANTLGMTSSLLFDQQAH